MNILEFACLRGGFTPAELGLPDDVLQNAGARPLEGIMERLSEPLYCAVFSGSSFAWAEKRLRDGETRGHGDRRPSLPAETDREGKAEKSTAASRRLPSSKHPKQKHFVVQTSEIKPSESAQAGDWERVQVRLAEAAALRMRGAL